MPVAKKCFKAYPCSPYCFTIWFCPTNSAFSLKRLKLIIFEIKLLLMISEQQNQTQISNRSLGEYIRIIELLVQRDKTMSPLVTVQAISLISWRFFVGLGYLSSVDLSHKHVTKRCRHNGKQCDSVFRSSPIQVHTVFRFQTCLSEYLRSIR